MIEIKQHSSYRRLKIKTRRLMQKYLVAVKAMREIKNQKMFLKRH